MFDIENIPTSLWQSNNSMLLTETKRGVERECLRASAQANISMQPHPHQLGAALTHPQITTDFSEALMELITPPCRTAEGLLSHLSLIQRYALQHLGDQDEVLWSTSMPCHIDNDRSIPVANYGSSNNGVMKTVYRIGLGHRYGRSMQTVAGVHYNFSLPKAFWAFMSQNERSNLGLQAYIDRGYFSLIRNFRRHYWLLIYLFGSSPALDRSFVRNRKHNLSELHPLQQCLYLPYATSLRMGDLGYQSSAQESLFICYNQSNTYIKSLCGAINQKHDAYHRIGLLDANHNYQQLNTNLLQIENEFYSAVRPKRSAKPGETALSALQHRGVEYIEVRCLDVNPFSPIGITSEQVHFLDTFLLWCALQNSPASDRDEFTKILHNQKMVVTRGREPDLRLEHPTMGKLSLTDWATNLLRALRPVAQLLDRAHESEEFERSLELQMNKVSDSEYTPSAMLLRQLLESGLELNDYAMRLSKRHASELAAEQLQATQLAHMHKMAQDSHAEQRRLEKSQQSEFKDFLSSYYHQYGKCEQIVSDCE